MAVILPGETPLYALTDSRLSLGRSTLEVSRALLEAGIRILQYREKKLGAARALEECRALRALTREYGACFIVNDHVDLAILAEADGVHAGQDDLPVREIRKLVGPKVCVGVSTHSPEQAWRAVADGADYIGVGPVFATATKEDVVPPVGYSYLEWVASTLDIPFVAIGGIKAVNIEEVAARGARCCALVSEFVSAPDIGAKVAETAAAMRRGMERAKRENICNHGAGEV